MKRRISLKSKVERIWLLVFVVLIFTKPVFALTESQKRMPQDILMNAVGYSGVNVSVGSSTVTLGRDTNWWDIGWTYKKQVTIKNVGQSAVTTTAMGQVTVDTTGLTILSNLNDLRLVYAVGATQTEVPRTATRMIGQTNVVQIAFPLQASIGSTASDGNYYLYYGNVSASAPSWPKEKFLSFDGVNDTVDLGASSADLNNNDVQTVMFWMKANIDTNNWARLIAKYTSSPAIGWHITQSGTSNTGDIRIDTSAQFNQNYYINAPMFDGGWHHVAVVMNAGSLKAYIDGVNKLDTSYLLGDGTNNTGRIKLSNSSTYKGMMDEVEIWNRALSQSEIQSRMNKEIDSSDVYWSNIKGYWKMNEGTGQIVNDSSGNNVSGTLGANNSANTDDPTWMTGGNVTYNIGGKMATFVVPLNGSNNALVAGGSTAPTVATGPFRYTTKGALNFNGFNSYVDAGTSPALNLSGSYSIGMWVNVIETSAAQSLLNNYVDSQNNMHFFVGGGKIQFQPMRNGTIYRVVTNSFTQTNQWVFLVATFDGNSSNLYVNGTMPAVSYANSAYAMPSSGSKLRLGRRPDGIMPFRGLMDEVVVWDKVLSAAEVSALYNSGSPAPIIPDSNVKVLYHFDENGDDPRMSGKAIDASGNGNNGIIYGAKYTDGIVPAGEMSHQGVMLEEGTTNVVVNPSFESSISTGWINKITQNYGNGTTDIDGNVLIGSTVVTDVFYYDSTRDSDGGAWRNNATAMASSWYSEGFSSTRGKKKEFPEKSYLVATVTDVSIIDAVENKLWMRFSKYYLNQTISSITALNGRMYFGVNGVSASSNALNFVDFKQDLGGFYYSSGIFNWNSSTVGSRGSWDNGTYSNVNGGIQIINRTVNDVSVASIGGAQYVAVATDGGVSVINETAGTVVNIYSNSQTQVYKNVFLTLNALYFSYNIGSTINPWKLGAVYTNSSVWQNGTTAMASSLTPSGYYVAGPVVQGGMANGLLLPPGGNYYGFNTIYVTPGTSTADGVSNTIYLGNSIGLMVIQEKQGDESHGSVKYYDKNHITEEMVGAIKGQWGFWETTTTEANQFKASGYLDTGKLSQAVSLYGNAANNAGPTLTFNRGNQISGNNYEHFNKNQGTISLWIKPTWAGNDGALHYIFSSQAGTDQTGDISIYKDATNYLRFNVYNGATPLLSTAGWSANSWHHLVFIWNATNTLNGTNYEAISVDGSALSYAATSGWTSTSVAKQFYLGSKFDGTSPVQALIDDFAIYDRVLTTAEITSIYNSGNGNEAGYVADSSLKFYAKMDGSGSLQPVTYNGGASASKMTRNSSELAGGTNLLLNGNLEVATSGAPTSWTLNNSPLLADAEAANIISDTRSQKITGVGVGSGINQAFVVASNSNYTFSFWDKVSSGTLSIIVRDNTNTVDLATVTFNNATWANNQIAFKAPSNCTSVIIKMRALADADVVYLDNLVVTPNLVDNGGMEGQYTATGAALYSATTAQVRSGAGPYVYTESGKFATGLAGLIATDGTNFGYITASDANSVTVDFTGGNGTIATNAVFDVKSATAPGWTLINSGGSFARESSAIHSGTYATKITRATGPVTMLETLNVTAGNYYLLSFWTRGDGTNAGRYAIYDGTHVSYLIAATTTGVTGTTYTRFSAIFQIPSGCTTIQPQFSTTTGASSTYFDDISVTPLDNVALSLKAWAPVSDSSAIGSSLSVQGSSTGVQSLASGVRNSAYTFDGSTGYLRQQTIAVNVGTLAYLGNDTTTAQFEDDGLDFSTYQTTSGNAAYMIVVTNSDNTTSWGYMGAASGGNINIYTTKALATRGWSGTAPIAGSKVPVGYEIKKTDFQITGNITVGAWFKTPATSLTSINKGDGDNTGYRLFTIANVPTFRTVGSGVGATGTVGSFNDGNWHYLVGVNNGTNNLIYVDGVLGGSASSPVVIDSPNPLVIGARSYASTVDAYASGSIDEPFVTADALSAAQILDMYNKGLGALNHVTKTDQKLAGTTNTVQSVWGSADGTTIYAGTDTAMSIIKNGKIGNYTDSDSVIMTPTLQSANTNSLAVVGLGVGTTPVFIAGSSVYGVSVNNGNLVAASVATSAPYFKFGSSALKLNNSLNPLDSVYSIGTSLGIGTTYSLSAYVYSDGSSITSSDAVLYSQNQSIGTTYEDAGGGWWRLSALLTIGTTMSQNYGVQVKPAKTIYVDGVQLENKNYVTTYADGSMGTMYSWIGSANNSMSNRASPLLLYSAANNISVGTRGAFSVWFKPNWASTDVMAKRLFYADSSLNALHSITWAGGKFSLLFNDGGIYRSAASPSLAFASGTWLHLVGNWDISTGMQMYINGIGGTVMSVGMTGGGAWTNIRVGGNSGGEYINGVLSEMRIYDQTLSSVEVADLYNQGLTSHSSGAESGARYANSGSYFSPVVDLSANGQWGSVPITFSDTGSTIAYWTRTSSDNVSWNNWLPTSGNTIVSDPRRYFQWRADLSGNQLTTPTVSGMTVAYVEDTQAPLNIGATEVTVYSAVGSTQTIATSTWNNYATPVFIWVGATDVTANGQSASGVASYKVLLTQNIGATPTSNVADACFLSTTDSDRTFKVGINPVGCHISSGTWYLRMQVVDNSGNVSEPVTLFTDEYDSETPEAPASVSTTTIGYSANNTFTFFWPTAADIGPAGVKGYEYKTGVGGTSPYANWQFTSATTISDIPAYTEGANTFYVRTVDNAGNYSQATTNNGTAAYYYNQSAPIAPQNVSIGPSSSAVMPAANNSFTVTWDKPATYSGDIAKYYYCVNCTPSALMMAATTNDETVLRKLTNMPLATQQGKNTFYLVAEDNTINTQTGHGNINYDAYASVDFYAATLAPAAPVNVTISDASDRNNSKWRLTLAWDIGSTVSTVDHYDIYRSLDNSAFVKAGTVTGTAYTDGSLKQSTKYYYYVKAIDNAGSNSIASTTISFTPEGRYTDPPAAGGTPTVETGSSVATIKWGTSRVAYGSAEYGKTTSYGSAASETTALVDHVIKITGLSPGVTYHYRVQSLDDTGLVGYERSAAYSSDNTFTTLSAPEISTISVVDVGLNVATISWKTRTLATTVVEYGLTTEYGTKVEVSTTADENTHTARLANLANGSTYHFRIRGTTADGDDIFSQDQSFVTVTFPKITAYVLKTDQNAGGTVINLAWASNVPVSSVVEYQYAQVKDNVFGVEQLMVMNQAELAMVPVVLSNDPLQISQAALTSTHVTKIENLRDGVIYIIRLRGRDQYGNEAVSDPIRYVTGADTRPPVLSNVSVESQLNGAGQAASAQLIISWETDEPATTQVLYGQGVGTEYQQSTEEEQGLTKQHTVVIHNLASSTSYHVLILSKDKAGNIVRSGDLIAVTPAISDSALDVVLQNLQDVFGFLKI